MPTLLASLRETARTHLRKANRLAAMRKYDDSRREAEMAVLILERCVAAEVSDGS